VSSFTRLMLQLLHTIAFHYTAFKLHYITFHSHPLLHSTYITLYNNTLHSNYITLRSTTLHSQPLLGVIDVVSAAAVESRSILWQSKVTADRPSSRQHRRSMVACTSRYRLLMTSTRFAGSSMTMWLPSLCQLLMSATDFLNSVAHCVISGHRPSSSLTSSLLSVCFTSD